MDNNENYIDQKDLEFPIEVKNLSTEECAKILRKALSTSKLFSTQSDISLFTKINPKTIGDYFCARHKPPQSKWIILREAFMGDEKNIVIEKKIKIPQLNEAKHSAEKLKIIAFLLKDELEYFKESSPEAREILKEHIPGPTIGYLASLLTALYDENQLAIFKNFSKK